MLTLITLNKIERCADNCPLACRQTTACITMLPTPMLVLVTRTQLFYLVARTDAYACCEYASFTWLPAPMLVLAAGTPALLCCQHGCFCSFTWFTAPMLVLAASMSALPGCQHGCLCLLLDALYQINCRQPSYATEYSSSPMP